MKEKIALVTAARAASAGAIALELARSGCDVAVVYAGREDAARETVAQIEALGARAMAVRCDVANEAQAAQAVREVTRRWAQSTSWSTTPALCATAWPCACPKTIFAT